MINTPDAVVTTLTHELEDRLMAALPQPISNWLRYEAASDISPAQVFRDWRHGATVPALLAHLRSAQRARTLSTYTSAHPQA